MNHIASIAATFCVTALLPASFAHAQSAAELANDGKNAACGSLQFVLTKQAPAQQWWRILQVIAVSLLGPFIGANAVFMLWLAPGGTM